MAFCIYFLQVLLLVFSRQQLPVRLVSGDDWQEDELRRRLFVVAAAAATAALQNDNSYYCSAASTTPARGTSTTPAEKDQFLAADRLSRD